MRNRPARAAQGRPRQPIPAAAALVAIDIAKTRNEVLLEVPGERRRRLTVLNTRREHDRLIEILTSIGLPVVAGFEATGNYHRPLAWRGPSGSRIGTSREKLSQAIQAAG